MYSSCGRSDDTLMLALSDFLPPQALESIGPCTCESTTFVMRGGKTNKDNRALYGSCLRHVSVLKCPVNTLGTYLFMLYTLGSVKFPDARDAQAWWVLVHFVQPMRLESPSPP